MNIYEISTQIRNIYEELQDGSGVDEETGEVLPEIIEALAIAKNELNDKAVDYAYVIKSFENEIDVYDKEIKRLTARKKQLENIKSRVADTVKNAMIEFGIDNVKGKTVQLSLRKSERVDVLDLSALKEEFKITKITIDPDKTAIRKAIKNGEDVEGAVLVENKSLQIK